MTPKQLTTFLLIVGLSLFGGGWAIRSTFIMSSFVNKPLGGIFITGGLVFAIWAFVRIINQHKL